MSYALKYYHRNPQTILAPAGLKAIHPPGESPVITAGGVQRRRLSFPVETAADRGGALTGRPRLAAFLQKIHARPAYRRALEKGGPYAYADEEQRGRPWRTRDSIAGRTSRCAAAR